MSRRGFTSANARGAAQRAGSNIFASARDEEVRSSTKRHAPPGGGSSLSFGAPAAQQRQQAPPQQQQQQQQPAAAAPAAAAAETKGDGERRGLFPPKKPFDSGFLQVSRIHKVYYEQAGDPRGQPVIVLHGGPGGGMQGSYNKFFGPQYRVIQFDQRGCGKSEPFASLEDNTTWTLVEDIERLRVHLKIERWVVFGGSWGSTLSLSYALVHPKRVKALVLRGIFTLRASELRFFYQDGASHLFPEAFELFKGAIPPAERHDLMGAYHRRLTGKDEKEKLRCARQWAKWEMSTSRLYVDPAYIARAEEDDKFSIAFARIESHFFANAGFFDYDGQLLEEIGPVLAAAKIPCSIVQGRYDVVCPARTAFELKQRYPAAELHMIKDAGHTCMEPGIVDALVRATDKYANLE